MFPFLHYKTNKWINLILLALIQEGLYSIDGFNLVNGKENAIPPLRKFHYIYYRFEQKFGE